MEHSCSKFGKTAGKTEQAVVHHNHVGGQQFRKGTQASRCGCFSSQVAALMSIADCFVFGEVGNGRSVAIRFLLDSPTCYQ